MPVNAFKYIIKIESGRKSGSNELTEYPVNRIELLR